MSATLPSPVQAHGASIFARIINSPLYYLHLLVCIMSITQVVLFGVPAFNALTVAVSAPVRQYVTSAQVSLLVIWLVLSLVYPLAALALHTYLAQELYKRLVVVSACKLACPCHVSTKK